MDHEHRRKAVERKLANARKHLEENIAVVTRRAKLIGEWQRRVRYYETEIMKTADDLAAERARAEARKQERAKAKRTRLIAGREEEV